MSRFATSARNFWRAFRQGPGTPRIRHHGHDLARTAKDAYTVSHRRGGGGFSGTSAVDEHVAGGAGDYAKSFDRNK